MKRTLISLLAFILLYGTTACSPSAPTPVETSTLPAVSTNTPLPTEISAAATTFTPLPTATLPSQAILTPSVIPPAARLASLAYDPMRNTVVQFGGSIPAVDEYNQKMWLLDTNTNSWRNIDSGVMPPGRESASMVYDPNSKSLLLFGGNSGSNINDYLGDTWLWDGKTWTQVSSQNSPSPRADAVMAFDAEQNAVILFGGFIPIGARTGKVFDETWKWDGHSWTLLHPAISPSSPSSNNRYSIAYDGLRKVIVLYANENGETWTWDGLNWAKQNTSKSPYAINVISMSYDELHQEVVLFGTEFSTILGDGNVQEDTWLWDGTNWTGEAYKIASSSRIIEGHLVYDLNRQILFLYGITGDKFSGQKWSLRIWNGEGWEKVY